MIPKEAETLEDSVLSSDKVGIGAISNSNKSSLQMAISDVHKGFPSKR